jgi:hypothetical protein
MSLRHNMEMGTDLCAENRAKKIIVEKQDAPDMIW